MKTDLYIGPLIERGGKFAYDTFSQVDRLRSLFRYPHRAGAIRPARDNC